MRIRNAAVWTDEHFVILITQRCTKGKMTMSEKGDFLFIYGHCNNFSIYLIHDGYIFVFYSSSNILFSVEAL